MSSQDAPNNPSSSNTGNNPNQPSLVAGHAEYIKGVAENAIGSLTGSEAWKTSGQQDIAHATSTMQAAYESRDPSKQGYGKTEELAGKALGCQGMQKEGAASAHKD